MISISVETPDDIGSIRAITLEAFTRSEFGHNGEAEIVDLLRDHCPESLSLVARSKETILGHILFSPVAIRSENRTILGMGLGPMSVAPDCQRAGIGTKLIQYGLQQLVENECPFVVVLGHGGFYSRVGFVPASQHGIIHGFDGVPQEAFFVNILKDGVLDAIAGGTAIYRTEFGPQRF